MKQLIETANEICCFALYFFSIKSIESVLKNVRSRDVRLTASQAVAELQKAVMISTLYLSLHNEQTTKLKKTGASRCCP